MDQVTLLKQEKLCVKDRREGQDVLYNILDQLWLLMLLLLSGISKSSISNTLLIGGLHRPAGNQNESARRGFHEASNIYRGLSRRASLLI